MLFLVPCNTTEVIVATHVGSKIWHDFWYQVGPNYQTKNMHLLALVFQGCLLKYRALTFPRTRPLVNTFPCVYIWSVGFPYVCFRRTDIFLRPSWGEALPCEVWAHWVCGRNRSFAHCEDVTRWSMEGKLWKLPRVSWEWVCVKRPKSQACQREGCRIQAGSNTSTDNGWS